MTKLLFSSFWASVGNQKCQHGSNLICTVRGFLVGNFFFSFMGTLVCGNDQPLIEVTMVCTKDNGHFPMSFITQCS